MVKRGWKARKTEKPAEHKAEIKWQLCYHILANSGICIDGSCFLLKILDSAHHFDHYTF